MSDDLVKREFLVFKAGRGWYRSESQGYTNFKFDAGRYTEKEAISITHPNGEDGPRDGMYYRHESEVRDYVSDRIEALESSLSEMRRMREAAVRHAEKAEAKLEECEARLNKAVGGLNEIANPKHPFGASAVALHTLAELKGNTK